MAGIARPMPTANAGGFFPGVAAPIPEMGEDGKIKWTLPAGAQTDERGIYEVPGQGYGVIADNAKFDQHYSNPNPAPQAPQPAPPPAPAPAPAPERTSQPAPAPAMPAPPATPAPQAGAAVSALQQRAMPIDAGAGWEQVSTPGLTRPGLGQRLPFVPARSNGIRY